MQKINFNEYINYKALKSFIPLNGTFELTSRCNFNCKMCYIHNADCNKNEQYELSAAQWLDIAQKAKKAGMLNLLITGGEPLIRKDFAEIYTGIAKMGFIVKLNTNASLIDEKILDLFREYPPSAVNVSLYGDSDEKYGSLCGVKCYDKVIENISELKNNGIEVTVNSTLNEYNYDCIYGIHKNISELGIKNFKFTSYMFPPLPYIDRTDYDNIRLSPDTAADYALKYFKLKFDSEKFGKFADRISKLENNEMNECINDDTEYGRVRCRAGKTSFWIDCKGNMSICGMIPYENSLLNKSFEECWEQTKKFSQNIRLPKKCTVCKYRNICTSCAAVCYAETGKFDDITDYLCEYTKSFAKKAKDYIDNK